MSKEGYQLNSRPSKYIILSGYSFVECTRTYEIIRQSFRDVVVILICCLFASAFVVVLQSDSTGTGYYSPGVRGAGARSLTTYFPTRLEATVLNQRENFTDILPFLLLNL